MRGGKRRSVDEETLGFQGPSADLKQKCDRFKAAGDGLQCDAECCEGETFSHFKNTNIFDIQSQKYESNGLDLSSVTALIR